MERIYPAMTPIRIGIMEINPRPSTVARMVTMRVNMEIMTAMAFVIPCASPEKPDMLMASGASSRPIMATMEPIAAGGNSTSIHEVPIFFTRSARIMKDRPKQMNPLCASA